MSIKSIIAHTNIPPKVIMNKTFQYHGLPKYHLCAANPPKKNHNSNAVTLSLLATAAKGVITSLRLASSDVISAFVVVATVLLTGNDA